MCFESITKDEISQIDQNVREHGSIFAAKENNFECTDDELHRQKQLVNFFGETHASDPVNFRFEIGDLKTIDVVRNYLIEQKNVNGVKFLRQFRKKSTTKNAKQLKIDEFVDVNHNQQVSKDNSSDSI